MSTPELNIMEEGLKLQGESIKPLPRQYSFCGYCGQPLNNQYDRGIGYCAGRCQTEKFGD